ncbi:MAG: AraC family transcriptional regulator [Microbacterium sp.]
MVILPDLAPMTGPVAAVETMAHAATGPIAHADTKIIHVMNGRARIETAVGTRIVTRGDVLVLAAGAALSTTPDPWLRSWIVYVDEGFFREHMRWAIPEYAPLIQGVPPSSWDGSPIHLRLDPVRLARLEPILRRMSVTSAADNYAVASVNLALFAQAVEVVTPALLAERKPPHDPRRHDRVRRASAPPVRAEVRAAMAMIEERLSYSWRMSELASAVALSRSQLTRLSHRHLGVTPLQMQAELRVSEFTRLIEETDLTITEAARRVGWNDPRVATIRFQRRYGVTPSRYRRGA